MAEPGGPGTPGPGGPAVEGLLADQRRRGLRGESFRVEDYIARHPALRDDTEGLLDLIYNEVVLREERGESPVAPGIPCAIPRPGRAARRPLRGPRGDRGRCPPGRATTRSGAGSTSAYPAWPDPGWPALDGYEMVDVLGSGGMGIVYRARDLRHGVTVAVKTMRQVDAAAVYRFKQEFRALLDVSHPNLVTLHELISDGRRWFIVMEYIDGVTFWTTYAARSRPAGGDVSPSAWGLAPSTVDFPETAVAPTAGPGRAAGPRRARHCPGGSRAGRG